MSESRGVYYEECVSTGTMYGMYSTTTYGEENMEYIYEVIVVTEDRKLVLRDEVIADNPETAKILAGVGEIIMKRGLDPRKVTINCEVRGKVKVKPEPAEVVMVDKPGMPNVRLEGLDD